MAEKYGWRKEQQSNEKQTEEKSYGWRKDSSTDIVSTVANNVTERVNTWLKNHNNYISNYQTRNSGRKYSYEDSYVSDSGDWLDTVSKQKSNFDAEADSILSYLDQFKDYLDPDWANTVRDTLAGEREKQNKILEAYTKDNEWWSNFNDETEYQTAARYDGYSKKYTGQKAEDIQKALETLEDGEEKDWLNYNQYDLYKNDSAYNSVAASGWKSYEAQKTAQQQKEGSKSFWEKVAESYAYAPADTSLPAAAISNAQAAYRNDTSYREPNDKWSAEQKNHFGYLFSEDPSKAYTYAEQVNNQINAEKKYEQQQAVGGWASQNLGTGTLGTLGAIATAPLGMVDFLDDIVEYSARGTITQKGALSPFEFGQAAQSGVANKLNGVDENGVAQKVIDEDTFIFGGKGWGDVYSLGVSAANSLVSAYTLGGTGTLVNFIGQGGASGVDEALSRGAKPGQALLYGSIVGAAEGVTEMINADNLLKIGSSSTLKNYLLKELNQGIGESIEEGASSLIGNIADNIIMQDKSSFNVMVQELMEADPNLTEEEAKKKAWLRMVGDVAFDAIGGFVTGSTNAMAVGGVQTAVDSSNKNQKNIDAVNQYGKKTDTLIQEGLANDKNSDSYKLATKYQKQTQGTEKKAGKAMTGAQIRNLLAANQDQITAKDIQKIEKAAAQRLATLGQREDILKTAKLATKYATGGKLSASERSFLVRSQYGSQAASELLPDGISPDKLLSRWENDMTDGMADTYSTEWRENIGTKTVNRAAYDKKNFEAEVRTILEQMANAEDPNAYKPLESRVETEEPAKVSDTGKAVIRATGKEVDLSKPNIKEITKDGVILEVDGELVNSNDIDYANEDQAYAMNAISKIEHITPAVAGTFIAELDTTKSVGKQLNGMDEAFTYGFYNYSEADLKAGNFTGSLTQVQLNDAYKLGQYVRGKSDIDADAPVVKMRTEAEAKLSEEQKLAKQKAQIESDDVEVYFEEGGTAVKFDEHSGKYDKKRMAAVNTAKFLAKLKIGGKYYFFESYVNEDGDRVYKDADGNEVEAPNGIYRESDGSIHIDLNAGNDGSGIALYTLGHELAHFVKAQSKKQFKILADLVTEAFDKTDLSMRERVLEKQKFLEDKRGEKVSYDEAYEEVVADAMSTMLTDGTFHEKLMEIKVKDKGLFNTIKRFFEKMIAKFRKEYEQLTPDQKDAQDIRAMKDMFDKIQTAFAEALVEASENFRASEQVLAESGIAVNSKTESGSLLSVRDVLKETDRQKVAKALAERFNVTVKEAMEWLKAETSLASIILNPKYSAFLDYEADPNEVAIKQNSDYPQGTVDFSNICKKRREFTQVMNRILRNFPNHVFAATDLAKIRTIMGEEGMTLPCGICYVEDRRQLDTIVAQDFIDGLKLYREGSKTRPDGKPFNANQLKGLQLTDGDTYVPTIYELVSLEGRNSLKAKNPNMEAAWVKYNNARCMQAVRLLTNEAEYKRQILKYSPKTVQTKNDYGGLRIYSFSDAEMFHLIDIVQVLTDCATVGLKVQGYTKVNEYAKAVKDTGEKLNRSLIPLGDLGYHIENGKVVLDYDTVEGIDITSEDFFDNKDNPDVGNITIGVNDIQIRAAMVSDFVDQIIPFHTGQSEEVLGEKGIAAWKNYKDFQTEKDIATGKTSSHQVNIYTEVIQAAENEGKPIQNKRQFVEKFLEVCKENGLQPRFSDFLNTDAQGNYIYTEGYHKFLVDFKTFAQTEVGEYLPQMPVKPIFDDAYITSLLTDYVAEQKVKDAEVAKQMPKVVDRITNEIVKPNVGADRGAKYSWRNDSKGNKYWAIDTQKDIFKGLKTTQEYESAAFNYLLGQRDNNVVVDAIDGKQMKFIRLSAEEFTRSDESQDLMQNNPVMFAQKMRLIPSLDDLAANANVNWWSPDHKNHKLFKAGGFENFRGRVGIDDVIFNFVIRAGKAKFGDIFYDINLEVDQFLPHAKDASEINGSTSFNKKVSQPKPKVKKNSGRNSDRDSTGKQLTKEQQDYFKDSVVRDENGNLKVMYHGTSRGGFNVFDTYGGNHGLFGIGSYFTDSKNIGESYTKKGKGKNPQVYETYLNIKNPMDMDAEANPSEWAKAFEDVDFPESGTNEDFYRAVEEFYMDQWMTKWDVAEAIQGTIESGMGYDGITHIGGGRVNPNGERHRVYIAFNSEQIKNTDNLNPTDSLDIRYSERGNAPTFYSQMGKVVDGMKQEKFGASSVISMLRGNGVKAEEIRWSGIHAWLDGKKSVTKAELLDFINGSMLQIEEESRGGDDFNEFMTEWRRLMDYDAEAENVVLDEKFLAEAEEFLQNAVDEGNLDQEEMDHLMDLAQKAKDGGRPSKWNQYKLDGGENYRELIFRLPGSDYSNKGMQAHWGRNAKGILAHARMQDFNTFIGKMLFIEEIQSDWHNEGQTKGYYKEGQRKEWEIRHDTDTAYREFFRSDAIRSIDRQLQDNGYFNSPIIVARLFDGDSSIYDFLERQNVKISAEEREYIDSVVAEEAKRQEELQGAAKTGSVPDAPFKSNYHEYVLKRLLRMAAEEGYDSIGWTTADIQSDRWSDEYAEGYRIEYDQDIPKFLRKYGKQWGTTVGKTVLDNGTEVWSMAITDSMQKSVLEEGQVLYSERTGDSVSNRHLLANAFEGITNGSEEYKLIQKYKGYIAELNSLDEKLSEFNHEIRKIRFGKGEYDAEKLNKLEGEAKKIADAINKYDQYLVSLEASAPLRRVIERERKKEKQKVREHINEIQQNKKLRAEQTELRHKIRRTIRDLDKILNRGNKKLNVKEDMKGFVSKALELADYLFTDHISNDDLIRRGITVSMRGNEPQLVKETEEILSKLYDQADSLTDEEFTRLDAKRKANMEKLRELLKAQRNEMLNVPVYNLFNDLVTEYASLKNSKQDSVKAAYDEVLENSLRAFMGDEDRVKILKNMRVADMTTEELNWLYRAYTMVLTNVRNANKFHVQGMTQTIEQVVGQIAGDFGSRKIPEKKLAIAAQKLANKIGWDYEKLYYALDRIGSDAFTKLIMNLANSENNVMQDIIEAMVFRDQIVKKYGFNEWAVNKEIDREFMDNSGKKFKMTLGQMMSLYAYSRREGAWDHIEYGGFVFGEAALTNPRPADSYKLSKAQCEAITNLLTKEQKGYVEDMQKYLSEVMGAKGNEVSMQLYGIKMFGEKNYFPIHIAGQFKAQANESQAKAAAGFQSMSNAGFTHAQNPNAKAPFVLEGFNEIWADHVNEMSRYHGTVPALEDIRRVMNRSTYSDSVAESQSIKQLMENHYGKEAVDYFDNLYREANSGAITDKLQKKSKKLLSLFRKNSVAYSLSVLIQQPASLVRAYALIGKKYFGFKGFGTITSGVAKAVSSKWNPAYANAYNEMLKYAPGVTMAKEIGGFDTATGGSIRSTLLDTGKSLKQKWNTGTALEKGKAVLDVVDDNAIANLPNVADKIAWIEIWNACKRETVATHKDLAANSEEFMQAVGERFTEVIRATQVYDSIFAKSPMLKSKNLAVQYLVSFMNEPNTVANMVENAVRSATRGDWKQGARTAGVVVYSIIFTNVLKSIVYAMRDDDEDETYIEKYIEAITDGMMSDINALNYIPLVRDAWSVAQGYDVERADMAIVADAIDALSKVVKNATTQTDDMTEEQLIAFDKKVTDAKWKLVESMAAFFGIPVKNIRREIEGVLNTAKNTAANQGLTTKKSAWDKVYDSVVDSIPFMSSKAKNKQDKLYEAILSGDKAYVDRLKSTYKTDDAYHSAVRTALRDNDPRIKEAAQAQINGNPSERVRIAKLIIADGFIQDDVVMAINAEINAMTPDDSSSGAKKEKGFYTVEDLITEAANGDRTAANAIKDDVLQTAQKNGKTLEEAEKNFVSNVKSEAKKAYLAGSLNDAVAEKILLEYTDMDEEETAAMVSYWAFSKANPDYDLSQSSVKKYQEFAEPADIPLDVFVQYVEGTKGLETIKDEWGDEVESVRDQVLAVIDSLDLTWQQKDALYLAHGYAESEIWDVPW